MSGRHAASVTIFPLTGSRVRRRARQHQGEAIGGFRQLRLVAAGDGWSLVSLAGEPVFSAEGRRRGRSRCLEFARDRGVVALVS